ncbi:MAG: M1 family metallopeptidase, partial [Candidatus Kapaibacterium sp.]
MHSISRVPRWILFALMLIPTITHAWQQEVHYTMDIRLDAEHHSYDGTQRLVYTNNSPDTLREVYYHLYYEAFKPGSMMDVRDNSIPNGGLGLAQLLPDEQGEVKVGALTQDGRELTWSLDETILHVTLARPLLPGDSTLLEMAWHTHIPRLLRRGGWMSREGIEYSMSQWYPKMVEYDRNGWHDDEYVRREFYGVYGTFDISISLPAKYVVGATGVVTNPREVGCGYELGAVDTTILSPASGSGTKTWKFHAENVHDFAWVADPDYFHKITRWQNVTIHVLASRYLASLWRSSALWTAAIMDYYSARFGRYAWPQFTVAMAGDGGMEYPQLIMITGNRTPGSLAGVIAHELGHQWYYGMIGNNETQEAWMDEGFTQYLTDEASRNVLQIQGGSNPYTGLNRIVYPWTPGRWANVEEAYRQAAEGFDEPLNTYHDRFREDATSGLVYSKGEAVLRMVQYMFGDSLFDAAMRHYYNRWKFHHPDARDFERSMEEASGMRLDWFFNEWIGSRKLCDYAVDDLESDRSGSGYATTIDLSNRNEAIMPLDVTLTYDDGSTAIANIPVENWRKPTMDFNLPRWKWTSRTYRTTFTTPRQVVRATIDTSVIMFDIDRTNNSFGTGFLANLLPPSQAAFYRRWDFHRPLDFYSIRLRPTLWYGEKDGAQLGFVADGGYAFDRYNAKAGLYFNFLSKRVDYDLRYGSTLDILGRDASYALLATNADGVQRWGASVSKRIRPFYYSTQQNHAVTVGAEREVLVGPAYPNAIAPWTGGGFNTLSLGYSFAGNFRESNLTARGSFDFDASFASASEFTQWRLAAGTSWNPGTFAFGGEMFLGASLGAPPAQRLFNPAGATSRDMHLNETNRLMMNINPGFAARNHLVLPTQGYLFSLASLDPAARLAGNLMTARVTMGNINPFAQFAIFGGKKLPYLEKIDLKLYAAGGWIFGDAITWKGFSDFNYEGGLMASIRSLMV